MFEIIQSNEFSAWSAKLRDKMAAARIADRMRLAELGNLGDYQGARPEVFALTGAWLRHSPCNIPSVHALDQIQRKPLHD